MPDRTGTAQTQIDPGTVRLLAFAGARDVIGAAEVAIQVPGPCDAAELWSVLLSRFPALAPYKRSIRLAVNGAYANETDRVGPGDEVALIPPVAGG